MATAVHWRKEDLGAVKSKLSEIVALLNKPGAPTISPGVGIKIGNLNLDFERHIATVNGKVIRLALKEYKIMRLLIDAGGKVCGREQILESIFDASVSHGTRIIDQHVTRMRRKLRSEGFRVVTVFGYGYRFNGQ